MLNGPPRLRPPAPIPVRGTDPVWRHVLRDAGYPTDVVVIDFESFFAPDYHMDSKKSDGLSTIEFIMDPRFEEIGHAIVHIKQPWEPVTPSFWWGGDHSYIDYLVREYGTDLEGVTVVAQNAGFDCTVLVRKYGICPRYVVDTIGLIRHQDSRDRAGLASAAERYNLPFKGKTEDFKGWTLAALLAEAEKAKAMADYAKHDAWLEFNLFARLLPELSRPTVELALMQHTLEMFLKPTLKVDQAFAVELTSQMQKRVDDIVAVTGATKEDISGNNSFSRLLGTALEQAGDQLLKYQKPNKKGDLILAVAKTDDQLELLQGHHDQTVRQLIEARTAIKSWPNHINRVARIARQAGAAGGLLPVPLRYHGAHTGRWSGSEKINLQNLSSRSKEQLLNDIRKLLEAPDDYSLVVVDASQIEARGLSWIAKQEDLNDAFREGREIYCEYAGKMAGRRLRKARKTDPGPLRKYYERMRNMGKVQVLGCGYGMGADKCVAFAGNSYGVDITLNEAVLLVRSYRESVPCITKFWRVVEQKFKAAARYGEPSTMDYGLSFHRDGDVTIITLPSGRILRYPEVKVSIIDGKDRLWMPDPMKPGNRIFMWGGYLTENIVQALSRDILGEAVLETEKRGWHVALHVHDEIVAVVPDAEAPAALEGIIEILSIPPAWMVNGPLAAEGKITKRYEK